VMPLAQCRIVAFFSPASEVVMSYQVLARKWRPQVFEDVVGQGHITRTLQNAIATNRLAHAFLFSGPRGVGKTTTARILAKALNCKGGPTPHPCGLCDSCRETAAGTSVDVIEIDGASNRGIEHIRELRETVKYAPVGGKYKVYVIDEVHMLTNEAFNALLKTLEEPPPHVVFIFATTEPHKIPATIHSRCQRYGFKRILLHEISATLREIADREGIAISDQGLGMIANAAEGSMRDSQSLLDQAVSYSGMTIRDEDLQSILGSVPQQTLLAFTEKLLQQDSAALLEQIDALLEQGQDMRQFLAGLVEHLRNLIIARTAKEPGRIIERSASEVEGIRQQASGAGTEQLILLFDGLSRTLDEIRWSPHQRFTIEIGIVKACTLGPLRPIGEVLERLMSLEAQLAPGATMTGAPERGGVRERPAAYAPASVAAAPAASAQQGASGPPSRQWEKIVAALKQMKPGLASALGASAVLESTASSMVIGIRGGAFHLGQVEKKDNREIIEQTAFSLLNSRVQITFRLMTEETRGAKALSAKRPATQRPEPDPLLRDAVDIFQGQIIDTRPEESDA
jgi:DNA polymerase-3 subunit gamma/tau